MKHHINKVILDFSFAEKEKESALQKAKKLFYDDALLHLDSAFDKTNNNIYIDKLEIDLGNVTEAEFAERFSAALSDVFLKSSFKTKYNNIKMPAESVPAEKKSLLVDDVVFLLKNGYWQWHIQNKNEEEIIKLVTAFLQNNQLVFLLFDRIRTDDSVAVQRITWLFNQNKTLQKYFFEALLLLHPYLIEARLFFEKIYAKAIDGDENFSEAFINKLYKNERLKTFTDFKILVSELIEENIIKSKKISRERQLLINKINKYLNSNENDADKLLSLLERMLSAKNIFITDTEVDKSSTSLSFLNQQEDKISINNAGLILLHPYLQFVFFELGFINEAKQFISFKAQQKAVLFLQFLINGKYKHQEHLLVLNKILCGFPINMPVKIKHQFTAAEKKAGEEILDSFIEHWSVLRNTSRRGLIESFINRKGLIQKTGENFLVQVEKNSIDILLDSLPFGIRTIKLPWNEYIIYTEWAF